MPVIDIEYIRADSPIHRMHPFVLVVFEFAVAVIAATFNHPLALLIVIATIAGILKIAKVPLKKLKYMWITVAVGVIFVITQGIWFTSFGALAESDFQPHVLFHLWPGWLPGDEHVAFTLEGAVFGLSLGMRFAAIALAFPLLVMTIHPADLTNALARIRVFGRKLPYSFVFVLVNAIRYVPMMSKQFDETMDAQRARGVEFDRGGPIRRTRALFSVLIPVVTTALISGRDLTLALETRGFGAVEDRTFMRAVRLRRADRALLAALVAVTVLALYVGRDHFGDLSYTRGIF